MNNNETRKANHRQERNVDIELRAERYETESLRGYRLMSLGNLREVSDENEGQQ